MAAFDRSAEAVWLLVLRACDRRSVGAFARTCRRARALVARLTGDVLFMRRHLTRRVLVRSGDLFDINMSLVAPSIGPHGPALLLSGREQLVVTFRFGVVHGPMLQYRCPADVHVHSHWHPDGGRCRSPHLMAVRWFDRGRLSGWQVLLGRNGTARASLHYRSGALMTVQTVPLPDEGALVAAVQFDDNLVLREYLFPAGPPSDGRHCRYAVEPLPDGKWRGTVADAVRACHAALGCADFSRDAMFTSRSPRARASRTRPDLSAPTRCPPRP